MELAPGLGLSAADYGFDGFRADAECERVGSDGGPDVSSGLIVNRTAQKTQPACVLIWIMCGLKRAKCARLPMVGGADKLPAWGASTHEGGALEFESGDNLLFRP